MSACMSFPRQHRAKLHSTNLIERLNKDVRRRSDVLEMFPNEASIMRLIGAVLFEANDEWQTLSRYIMVEAFAEIDKEKIGPFSAQPGKPPDHALGPVRNLHQLDGRDLFNLYLLLVEDCARHQLRPFSFLTSMFLNNSIIFRALIYSDGLICLTNVNPSPNGKSITCRSRRDLSVEM